MITALAFLFMAALGAIMRALIGKSLNRTDGLALGTLGVNVVGSFLLGLLHNVTAPTITVLGVGFLGSLTTYSSFTRDAIALFELRRVALSSFYVVSTVTICLAAAYAGIHLAPT